MPTTGQAISNYLTILSLEGKSTEYIDWLRHRLGDFAQFLQRRQGQSEINNLTVNFGREFVKNLMERKSRYTSHKLLQEVEGGLASITIHGYVRALPALVQYLVVRRRSHRHEYPCQNQASQTCSRVHLSADRR